MKDLSKDEMARLLKDEKDGVLALTDGTKPYCIPLCFVYVNDAVYFTLFPTGRKLEYFQKNQNVCFNVFRWNEGRTEWSSVVVDGEMEPVKDIETIESVVKANIEMMGLDPVNYLQKRMEYYKKNLDNPKALKVFKINASDMGGKKMHTTLGG